MQFWLLLVFAHVIAMSAGQYIGKVFVHKVHPYQILFYQYLASVITISVYIYFLKPESGFFDIPLWFVIIGFMYAFGITAYYNAKKQSLSKSKIVGTSASALAIVLAIIFLGEYQLLSPETEGGIKKLIGIVLSVIALLLFIDEKLIKEAKRHLIIRFG